MAYEKQQYQFKKKNIKTESLWKRTPCDCGYNFNIYISIFVYIIPVIQDSGHERD
jgi:hypothetical protein